MAAPETSPSKVVAPAGATRNVLLVATTAVLLLTAMSHMFFVVPTYRSLMAGVGAELSLPARLAVSISHFGLVIFAAGVVGVVVAWRKERGGAAGLFSTALAVVALCAALYLALVSTIYLDFARVAGRIH